MGMKHLTATSVLATTPVLAAALLVSGCASGSSVSAGATSTSGPTATAASQLPPSASGGSVSAAPAPASSAAGAPPGPTTVGGSAAASPTRAAAPSSAAAGSAPRVPAAATSAAVTYLGPKMAKPVRVAKTVTGATYKRLADDLDALKTQPADTAECMVMTGENATVTIATGGHTWVYTVDGSPCRAVRVTKDGVQQPKLTNSMSLLQQLRAIAGFTGMAHPLTG